MIVSSRFSRFSPNFHSKIIRIETMTRTNEIIRRSCFRIDSSPSGDSRHTFFPQKYAQMIGRMVFLSRDESQERFRRFSSRECVSCIFVCFTVIFVGIGNNEDVSRPRKNFLSFSRSTILKREISRIRHV